MWPTQQALLFCSIFTCIQGVPQLLFANRRDIRLVDAGDPHGNSTVVVSGLEDAAALDFIFEDSSIFWTDVTLEVIKRTWVNGTQNSEDIVTTGLVSPDGLGCDWLGRKLYWTDSETNRIEVSNLDGSHRKVLYWEALDQPRAIALDPLNGYMYWTDWGEVPKIEKAGMDGTPASRSILIKENIYWPNGLTLDYQDSRIYWADAKYHFIHSCRFDGTDRKGVIAGSLPHPFALTLYNATLYWTDWHTHAIHSCDKRTGASRKRVHENIFSPLDIHAYSPARQPKGRNPCGIRNGDCSHLCLMSPYRPYFRCACPTGVKLLADNKTCAKGAKEILLLARRTDLRRISLDTPDYTDVVLQLDNVRHAIAIDYDPVDGYVYWTDDETRTVSRAFLDGSGQEVVIASEVQQPDGVAVDWVARNIYWTDTGTDRIEVARLNGTSRKMLISNGLEEPRTIVLDPMSGHMYWTDWGKAPKIERANLDGSDRVTLVNVSLGWPNGLALDFVHRKLYWSDAMTDRIETADMDGRNRVVLVEGSDTLPHIFGFSLLGDYLYWTDWQRRSIERVNKFTGLQRSIIIDQLPDLMGLKAVDVTRIHGTNDCAHNNGGCSHLCLMRPQPKGRACACPMGLELADGRTCIVPEAFLLFTRVTDIRRISIETDHNDMVIPLDGVKEAIALDFDINDNRIYWTDTDLKSISRAFMNGSSLEHIVQYGLQYPEAMAVDWVAHNLYWADFGTKRIEMARMDGSSRKVLVWKDVEPRALALDPPNGYMYFSNWIDEKHPRIERAALDGSSRQVVVNDVGRANGLTIDFGEQKLYWTNLDNKTIESSSLSGGDHHSVLHQLTKPFSLTQYQDYIYWTDLDTNSIERANKSTGLNRTKIQDNLDHIMDILVFHASRQSGGNTCGTNNGGCSHLCVAHPVVLTRSVNAEPPPPTKAQHHCTCPTHYMLSTDNRTCLPPDSFLLYAQKTAIRRIVLDANDSPDIVLPIKGLRNIRSIDYDPVNHQVYWVDKRTKSICRARDNGTHVTPVIHSPPHQSRFQPYDIAIDPFTRHIYWTDSGSNVINVTRLDGRAVGIILNEKSQKPRNIVLSPKDGYMFWTNAAKPATIERAAMDATSQTSVVLIGLGKLQALAVDSKRLYWIDIEYKRIETADFDGGNRRVLVDHSINEPLALTVMGDYLYWIDQAKDLVERVNKTSGKDRLMIQGRLEQLRDIHAVQIVTEEDIRKHPCGIENGKCSHLCVAQKGGTRRCSCPLGLQLSSNLQDCLDPPTCKPDEFTCSSDATCIPAVWVCDGSAECPDNSDEQDCPTCSRLQFRCEKSGGCLPLKNRCDKVPQCTDGSDELNCAPCESPNQFECGQDRTCIDSALKCDGRIDCLNGDDESNCQSSPSPHRSESSTAHYTVTIVVCLLVVVVVLIALVLFCRRKTQHILMDDPLDIMMVSKPLNAIPYDRTPPNTLSSRKSANSGVIFQTGPSGPPLYDRARVTGASSSSSTATPYPQETLNPPPSPVTDRSLYVGDCYSSNSPSTVRSYRHFNNHKSKKLHNIPPLPTPCSTDVCEDSDLCCGRDHGCRSSLVDSTYDSDPFIPPPPTPRSHYLSDDYSCPPSPSTERSFFNPLPPPPSPVAHSDC